MKKEVSKKNTKPKKKNPNSCLPEKAVFVELSNVNGKNIFLSFFIV